MIKISFSLIRWVVGIHLFTCIAGEVDFNN
jgi:hypothetical protein